MQGQQLVCSGFGYGNILAMVNDGCADPMSFQASHLDRAANVQLLPVAVGRWPFLFMVACQDVEPGIHLACLKSVMLLRGSQVRAGKERARGAGGGGGGCIACFCRALAVPLLVGTLRYCAWYSFDISQQRHVALGAGAGGGRRGGQAGSKGCYTCTCVTPSTAWLPCDSRSEICSNGHF